jgi:hypothetical protein
MGSLGMPKMTAVCVDSAEVPRTKREYGKQLIASPERNPIELHAQEHGRAGGCDLALQFVLGDFGKLRQMPQKTRFERPVPMYRNRQSYDRSIAAVDVVTAVDSQQNPTMPFHNSAEVFPGSLLQTAISMIREDFSSAE